MSLMAFGGPLCGGCPVGGSGPSDLLEPPCIFNLDATALCITWLVHVGVCDMGLGQPFPYRRDPGTPTPSLGYTKTPEPQRKEMLICGAISALPVLSLEGQHLSPPLLFFSSPSFLPIWGGRRKIR